MVEGDHFVELEVGEGAVVVDVVAFPSRLLEFLRVGFVVGLEARDDLREGVGPRLVSVGRGRRP